jgi:hypothetical protein
MAREYTAHRHACASALQDTGTNSNTMIEIHLLWLGLVLAECG